MIALRIRLQNQLPKKALSKSMENDKIVPKMDKNTLGAVLEHFGEPLGAKMAQERQQERKSMKNVGL